MRLFTIVLFSIFIGHASIASDLFTIDGIKTSSNGATANQAKDKAVLTGEREAFAKLLERIASENVNSNILAINDEKLAELVQGIEVNDEKVTASYYSAILNISFNKALVENLLKDNSINFTNKKSAPIVLVPLLITNGQNMLFEEENPLRKAFAEVTGTNHVLTIIVPVNLRGVDKNKLSQNIEEFDQDTKNALLKIGQNYKAEKIIMIAAAANPTDASILNIRLQDIKEPASPIKEITLKAKDTNPDESIFTYAARSITAMLESQWIKNKTADNISLTKITFTIPLSNIEDFLFIRKRLENLGFLKEITVKLITTKYALVEVSFKEAFEDIRIKMEENGLRVENTGDNIIVTVKGELQ